MYLNLNKNNYHYTKLYHVIQNMILIVSRGYKSSFMYSSIIIMDDHFEMLVKISQIIFNQKGW